MSSVILSVFQAPAPPSVKAARNALRLGSAFGFCVFFILGFAFGYLSGRASRRTIVVLMVLLGLVSVIFLWLEAMAMWGIPPEVNLANFLGALLGWIGGILASRIRRRHTK